MHPRIVIDYTRCTGCQACVLSCALSHGQSIRTSASAIQIASSEDEGIHVPLLCIACAERSCIDACPEGAIRLDNYLGIPLIDRDRCIGCRACLSACPYAGIHFDDTVGRPVVCDLCGGDPLCVKVCSGERGMPGALTLRIAEEDHEAKHTATADRIQVYHHITKDGTTS